MIVAALRGGGGEPRCSFNIASAPRKCERFCQQPGLSLEGRLSHFCQRAPGKRQEKLAWVPRISSEGCTILVSILRRRMPRRLDEDAP